MITIRLYFVVKNKRPKYSVGMVVKSHINNGIMEDVQKK